MAYHLSVHAEIDGAPRRELYHKSLGADETIFGYWHLPACDRGFALVAQIYHEGLEVRGDQLDMLSGELQSLEEHWRATGAGKTLQIPHNVADGRGSLSPAPVCVFDHLTERLGFVRSDPDRSLIQQGVIEIS
jgi:hypothetical protein